MVKLVTVIRGFEQIDLHADTDKLLTCDMRLADLAEQHNTISFIEPSCWGNYLFCPVHTYINLHTDYMETSIYIASKICITVRDT